MHRFLGAINYLEKFCSQLSSVTQLQCNFSKEDMPFLWSTRHQQAFDSEKVLATSVACLAYFDVTAPLILHLDASDHGQGAALFQRIQPHSSSALDGSSLRPIAYSKRPNHYREALCANRKRVPGHCWSPQHIRVMAFGKIQHRIYTDHQPLQLIFKKDFASAPKCLQRMFLFLQRYNFTVLSVYIYYTLVATDNLSV